MRTLPRWDGPFPWAFEGNRLILVPHAGYGQNAYYDRASKSLQFYYFDSGDATVFTCLSADIVHHEFGHAVLDGIRPLLNESAQPETAAFHEFMGDLTAILMTVRNHTLRRHLAEITEGRFDRATTVSSIAEEFGQAVDNRPYLRTARNSYTMSSLPPGTGAHTLSQVLTGAIFDVLVAMGDQYQQESRNSPAKAFWDAADRLGRTAIQPLDLLPPVDVNFRDYALAVCRSQQLSDPLDPQGYYEMLIRIFRQREVLTAADEEDLKEPRYLTERLQLSVPHAIGDIARSRAAACRFLDDNREDLLIPASRDFFIADLYDAQKRGRQNLPLPRQVILQYAWREEVPLTGARFGKYEGRTTTMLCGGTLVFNENGVVLHWAMKPGSEPYGGKRDRTGKVQRKWAQAVAEGTARRDALLQHLATQIASGRAGAHPRRLQRNARLQRAPTGRHRRRGSGPLPTVAAFASVRRSLRRRTTGHRSTKMGNQLLIRTYNVGCGDCIYVRIPDDGDGFHILIDCGKKGNDDLLKKVVGLLADDLPAGKTAGRKRLDLLVATHRHEDHIKGFNPDWFSNIEVRNIWLSAAMDPDHPQAAGVNNLHQFAVRQMRALLDSGQSLTPEVEMLASLYGVNNEVADRTLMETLPKKNKIKPKYVHSGLKHRLKLPPDTAIHILAPEKDIDHYYLGEDVDNNLRGLQGFSARPSSGAAPQPATRPANISASDFGVLKSRMLSNAARLCRQRLLHSEQPQRRPAHRVAQPPPALCRRCRVGPRVQGRQGQRQLERHVGKAPRRPLERPHRFPEGRPSRKHQRHSTTPGARHRLSAAARRRHLFPSGHHPAGSAARRVSHGPGPGLDRTGVLRTYSRLPVARQSCHPGQQHHQLRYSF